MANRPASSIRRRRNARAIALDETGLATWDADLRTRRAVWSPRHFDILGYARAPGGRATTTMWWDAVHPDDRDAVREQWKAAEGGHGGLLRLTYRIVRRDDGELRWCETIARFVRAEHVIGVLIDVTDARRDEERRSLLARRWTTGRRTCSRWCRPWSP